MQCVNCHFENMPGVDQCGRCGSSLRLAQVAIDVHPPRAGRWAKRWRRRAPTFGSRAERSRAGLSSLADELVGPLLRVERPAGPVVRRMVVPGWPQIFCGRVLRGRIFLGSYLVLLAVAAVFFGTFGGSVALGLALAVHASSVLDVALAEGRQSPQVGYGLFACLMLGVFLYWPAGWLVTRVATPQVFQQDAPPFERGDVVLYSRVTEPGPGDVVLYTVPPARIARRTNYIYEVVGERADRILAGPGQVLTSRAGALLVDGNPVGWRPLNADYRIPGDWEIQVPHGCVLIIPSTDPYVAEYATAANLRQVCLVPAANVRGTVYVRHQPLDRFAFIR